MSKRYLNRNLKRLVGFSQLSEAQVSTVLEALYRCSLTDIALTGKTYIPFIGTIIVRKRNYRTSSKDAVQEIIQGSIHIDSRLKEDCKDIFIVAKTPETVDKVIEEYIVQLRGIIES